ncbi:peptidase S8 [Actinocatenispora thailandica]|uniref:Peptidase S8 n=1 Tax=Actinocatenispora thailandica TaxID=227318 RepID=A0A7R7HY02_9ACTN|nr:S53 family peptidase [Actinocatenispora thailandica]BCJ36772.1 peptidase S8 [Actinocatenispora thailandica]
MRSFPIGRTALVTALIAAAAGLSGATAPATASSASGAVRDVCPTARPGQVRCLAKVRTDRHGGRGVRDLAAPPAGYGPADLRSAYDLPATGGANQTVAVVDAGDAANAEADLAVYRDTYGLPACTTANGCFRKVNQAGQPSPLPDDQGWSVEIALDLDMVSAACPDCHILLVEADDAGYGPMAAAVDTAAALGATEISNSYGGGDYNGVDQYAASYRHPGVAVVASSGDSGYGNPSAPAEYPSVVAVGGTSLRRADNARGWSESAWSASGTGCSAYLAKPAWQHDPNCPNRMIADIAAVADPDTGLAVYETGQATGWIVVGGTSASSPLVAGIIALAGNPDRYPDASYFYAHADQLHDIVTGASSGIDCGGDYLCTALPGYDGLTGNGTPNGIAAF